MESHEEINLDILLREIRLFKRPFKLVELYNKETKAPVKGLISIHRNHTYSDYSFYIPALGLKPFGWAKTRNRNREKLFIIKFKVDPAWHDTEIAEWLIKMVLTDADNLGMSLKTDLRGRRDFYSKDELNVIIATVSKKLGFPTVSTKADFKATSFWSRILKNMGIAFGLRRPSDVKRRFSNENDDALLKKKTQALASAEQELKHIYLILSAGHFSNKTEVISLLSSRYNSPRAVLRRQRNGDNIYFGIYIPSLYGHRIGIARTVIYQDKLSLTRFVIDKKCRHLGVDSVLVIKIAAIAFRMKLKLSINIERVMSEDHYTILEVIEVLDNLDIKYNLEESGPNRKSQEITIGKVAEDRFNELFVTLPAKLETEE